MSQTPRKNLSRRKFLTLAGGMSAATLLAACTPAAPSVPATATSAPTAVPEATKASAATAQPTPPPLPTQNPVSGNRTAIEWWFDISNEADMKAYLAGVNKYNESQTKNELKIIPTKNNDAMITAVSGNKAPDLYITWDGGEPLGTWAHNGLLKPLDDFIAKDKIDMKQFNDASVAMGTFDSKLYGFPWQTDIVLLFYNKTHFKEVGLDPDKPPKTIPEAIEMGKKLTKTDGGKITRMGLQPPNWFGPWYTFLGFYKPQLLDIAKKKVTVDSPEMISALKDIKDLWNMYGDPKQVDEYNATLGNSLSPDDAFLTGKVSMVLDGDWRNGYEARYTQHKYGEEYGMAPVPAPAGKEDAYGTSYFFGMNFVMPYNAPHPDLGWEVIKYLTAPEADALITLNQYNDPANRKNYEDKDLRAKMIGIDVVFDVLLNKQDKLWYMPVTPITSQLSSSIQQQLDLVQHNKITPEEAVKAVNDAVQPEWDAVQ